MKNFLVFFVMTFVSFQAFGQGFYPFRYRISTDTIPNRYLITYTETDTTEGAMPDSIKIVVIDSVCDPRPNDIFFFTVIYPDTMFQNMYQYSDSIRIRYNPVIKLYYSSWKAYSAQTLKELAHPIIDTGETHHISQITIMGGTNVISWHTVYCKYPLSKRKINEIRAYLNNFERDLEPVCVRKKHCRISLPEL